MKNVPIQTAFRGYNGAEADTHGVVPDGQQVAVHRNTWVDRYYDNNINCTVTEYEHDCGGVWMRTLVAHAHRHGTKNEMSQSWADSLAMIYLGAIVAQRVREGWVIMAAGGLMVYLSKPKP